MTGDFIPTALQRRLMARWQHNFPLCATPYAVIAAAEGTDEAAVIAAFEDLAAAGVLSRIGATYRGPLAGAATLAAMAVPPQRLEEVAATVSAHDGVNHNYEREDRLNLWFVVTGPDPQAVTATLAAIAAQTGFEVLTMPMQEAYRLDLGFDPS